MRVRALFRLLVVVFVFVLPGADSLANDRLGCFNLSHKGHGELDLASVAVAVCACVRAAVACTRSFALEDTTNLQQQC
jgi:hypothetical protein